MTCNTITTEKRLLIIYDNRRLRISLCPRVGCSIISYSTATCLHQLSIETRQIMQFVWHASTNVFKVTERANGAAKLRYIRIWRTFPYLVCVSCWLSELVVRVLHTQYTGKCLIFNFVSNRLQYMYTNWKAPQSSRRILKYFEEKPSL